MNLSGGWTWHLRAWRRQGQWAATCEQLETWLLAQADMPRQTLVLIGASAGWMIPPAWLQQFSSIHTWDIDPWAGALFRWRHGRHLRRHQVSLHTHTGDALVQLPALTQAHPEALFWFDNLLGQLCLLQPGQPDKVEQHICALRTTLQAVAWGSVHDRLSGPVREPAPQLPPLRTVPAGGDANSRHHRQWLHSIQAQNPWRDHLTAHVFPHGTLVGQIAWPFGTGHWHWLEIGWRPAQQPADADATTTAP